MQILEKRHGLPFAIIIGNERRLALHIADPEFQDAFHATALISPVGLCEPFPSSWIWNELTCVVFTRLHRWDKLSIEQNLTALTEAASKRSGLVVLHFEFESDLRCLNISLSPQYILRL
jgi:hypothetical protein